MVFIRFIGKSAAIQEKQEISSFLDFLEFKLFLNLTATLKRLESLDLDSDSQHS
jgi:hypothetical protein